MKETLDLALLAHLKTFLTDRRSELFDTVLAERTRHFTVVTEDVYQIHNTSAVMRSCDVFGIQDLHVVEERLGKTIDREIAMGAPKWVNLYRHNSAQECMSTLRTQGYQIIATTPHNNSQLLHEFDVTNKAAFFFGTEKDGLRQVVLNPADVYLNLPMHGFSESLKLSVSAAIIFQQVVTTLRQSDVDWKLSEEEIQELQLDWTKKTIKSAAEIEARYYEQS
jgi:tRNA (guanosine-2'-O-)-methyltransferase